MLGMRYSIVTEYSLLRHVFAGSPDKICQLKLSPLLPLRISAALTEQQGRRIHSRDNFRAVAKACGSGYNKTTRNKVRYTTDSQRMRGCITFLYENAIAETLIGVHLPSK